MSEWLKIDVRERERERERERWRVRERNIAQAEKGGKRGVIEREREREIEFNLLFISVTLNY